MEDSWISLVPWVKMTLFIFDIFMIDFIIGTKVLTVNLKDKTWLGSR